MATELVPLYRVNNQHGHAGCGAGCWMLDVDEKNGEEHTPGYEHVLKAVVLESAITVQVLVSVFTGKKMDPIRGPVIQVPGTCSIW